MLQITSLNNIYIIILIPCTLQESTHNQKQYSINQGLVKFLPIKQPFKINSQSECFFHKTH